VNLSVSQARFWPPVSASKNSVPRGRVATAQALRELIGALSRSPKISQQPFAVLAGSGMVRHGSVLSARTPTISSAVYSWFAEGFDTLDLNEAKVLLNELAS
jgi:hypothetical protein